MTPTRFNRLRCIEPTFSLQRRQRRGTAEIELVLSVFTLAVILLLLTAALRIAMARLDTAQIAKLGASRAASTGEEPHSVNASPFPPVIGYTSIRPGLPNRTYSVRESRQITVYEGGSASPPSLAIRGQAVSISPAWTYSADPTGGADRTATEHWFKTWVDESQGPLISPLQLAPAWPP